jgi:hypothetical protein
MRSPVKPSGVVGVSSGSVAGAFVVAAVVVAAAAAVVVAAAVSSAAVGSALLQAVTDAIMQIEIIADISFFIESP